MSPSLSPSAEGFPDEAARRATGRRLEEHERKLAEFDRRFASMPGSASEPAGYDARPPFSQEIQAEPIPHRFRMPQVDPYDGTTNPLDHLESYRTLMRVQGATDALLCIAFHATIRKAARMWFTRLEPESINSFA